jgi:hypothetical protein
MLIELWERLRGYDKWVETDATIESSDVERTDYVDRAGNVSHTWASGDEVVWTDAHGKRESAKFKVDDESPLYQLVGGETVKIRYNPSKPEQYYFRELLRSRVHRFFQLTLYTTIFLVVLALLLWLRVAAGAK